MKIVAVETQPCAPRFKGHGYTMSFVVQRELGHRYVRLITDRGTSGTGEVSRSPAWPRDEQCDLEDPCLEALVGINVADVPQLLRRWRHNKRLTGVAFGVELAMLDLIGQSVDLPVSSLLDGPTTGTAPECLSLSSECPEQMAETIRTRGRDFPVVQSKLQGLDLDEDIRRVAAALGAIGPDQLLLADFNGALTPEVAVPVLRSLNDRRLIWEEPCETYEQNVEVARAIDGPLMFDQCLSNLATFVRAIEDRAAAAVVIKSDAIGGLSVGKTIRDMCTAAGMRFRIDGWWCGPIAAAGVLHLAIGAQDDALISTMELTDPIDTIKDHFHRPVPGQIGPIAANGLGAVTRVFDSVAPVEVTA